MTEDDLSNIIAGANGPLAITGGGTRGLDPGGTALSIAGLSGITLYEPGALTMVAQAGTPVAEIESALAAENQRLAFEPVDYRGLLGTEGDPRIGSVFATNSAGSRRFAVGGARDFLLGIRSIDGQGQIIKNGGRVMKNVTGYDLVKLMAGAYGTLGVLTEVSFKVLPRPETEASLVLHGLNDSVAIATLSRAITSPFEVSGAAHDPQAGKTVLRLEGFDQSVSYRMAQVKDLLAGACSEITEADRETSMAFWAMHRAASGFAPAGSDVWRVSCKPTDGPALAQRAAGVAHLFDWGGGLIWIALPAGTDLRARLGPFDGHATLIRGAADTVARLGRFHPEAPGVTQISRALRMRFDPRGILNAGLMDPVTEAA